MNKVRVCCGHNKFDRHMHLLQQSGLLIYPLTVIADRYSGVYSGGMFVAFNLDPWEVPKEAVGDDVTCVEFFSFTDIPFGIGNTMLDAVEDLERKLVEE